IDLKGAKVPARRDRTRRRRPNTGGRRVLCVRCASAKSIFGAGDEDAGATGLAPDALVDRSRRTVVVVARDELAPVDPQLTVEEMQLFYARMRMGWVTRAGRKPYQHADPVPFRVGREQLAFDPGRDLFPFRLRPLPRRWRHRLFPRLLGNAKRKTRLQRRRRSQHIGGPGDEPTVRRAEALHLALAIRARGNMGFGLGILALRQDLQSMSVRLFGAFA